MTTPVAPHGNEALAQAVAEAYKPRRRRQFCKRGHERTPENVMSQGRCKPCHNQRERERNAAQRAAAKAAAAKAGRIEQLNTACNTRGRDNYIARRRQRGIPQEGIRPC